MDPNDYPRPGVSPNVYSKDKSWGLAIIILSSLSVCCGLGVAGLGGALGIVGAGMAVSQAGENANAGAAAFGLGGGLIALFGIFLMASSAVQIAGGVGIMKSRRWGFVLTSVLAGISILLNVPQVLHGVGIVGMIVNALIAYYCWSRLSGKEGPVLV